VELLTDKIPANIPLIQPSNKAIIENVTAQIHQIYAQIKKNEESPNTDYLFSNLEAHENFENSVRKIEIMQNFDFVPRS
jgi:hypothetical protein